MREIDRLLPVDAEAARARERFTTDVQYYLGLNPRQLPSRYLYDALGSALFEAICQLPWYRVTRSELSLINQHAGEIFERAGRVTRLIELGSGSGEKLAALLSAGYHRPHPIEAHLVDISAAALTLARNTLSELPVRVVGHQASYEEGLAQMAGGRAAAVSGYGRTLALFLGSNIGNFDRPAAEALLCAIRSALVTGDLFLIGADLVKPERDLLAAYDDPLGVTAAFNKNLLVRINRELGGDFEVGRFGHRAVWNAEHSRIEMHLESLAPQTVTIAAAGLSIPFQAGETIWTESSYKFDPEDLVERLRHAGFAPVDQWLDREAGFVLTLVEAD
jgi:dimethylhistidine N-methyltransferase